MRLGMPNVQYIESEDGSCSLSYEGLGGGPAQAGGGSKYSLRVSHPRADIVARTTVQNVTFRRAKEQAMSEGLNYSALSLSEGREYDKKFAEKYGRSSFVVLFEIENGADHADIGELSERFCKMFFEMNAAYRYNNSEYPVCGEGYYPDKIEFNPWGFDNKDAQYFQAGEISNV